MTFAGIRTVKRMVLGGLCVGAVVLSTAAWPVSASSERARKFQLTKNCGEYQGNAGDWCTVTVSNLKRLVDAKVLYSQAAGVPAGLLDSNVVLDAGRGSRAVGRCTLDLVKRVGLCTFSDGTGDLAGFQARVDVTFVKDFDWRWNGTYSFDRD